MYKDYFVGIFVAVSLLGPLWWNYTLGSLWPLITDPAISLVLLSSRMACDQLPLLTDLRIPLIETIKRSLGKDFQFLGQGDGETMPRSLRLWESCWVWSWSCLATETWKAMAPWSGNTLVTLPWVLCSGSHSLWHGALCLSHAHPLPPPFWFTSWLLAKLLCWQTQLGSSSIYHAQRV